ncbi:hypothetical protein JCM11251_001532 [Rhodosporidiobolus azoricus]
MSPSGTSAAAPADGAAPATDGRKARSKGGCLTCKNRKKKCDETKLQEHGGSCERCHKSSYKCEWQAPLGQRPLKVFRSRSTAAQEAVAGAVGPAGLSLAANMAYGAFLQNPAALQAAMVDPIALCPLPYPALSAPFAAPAYAQPSPVPADTPSAAFSDALFRPAAVSDALPYPPVSVPAPLPTPPQAFQPSFASVAPTPTGLFPSLPLPSSTSTVLSAGPAIAGQDTLPRWTIIGSASSNASHSPPPLASTASPDMDLVLAAASRSFVVAGEAPELDPLYRAFSAGMLSTMPVDMVDVVCDELEKLARSTSLGRHAAEAMVTLARINHLRQQEHLVQPQHAAAFAQRLQELRDRGCFHFSKGLEHLSQDELPLPNRLLGCFDLLTYQFDAFGTSAAQAVLFLGESFIRQELGPRPLVSFASEDALSDLLCPYAWMDTVQSMVTPKRPCIFRFDDLPGNTSAASTMEREPWKAEESGFGPHPCLPITFMLCTVATIELDVDRENMSAEEVQRKAGVIERAVRGWRPPSPTVEDLADSGYVVEVMATVEMWRHAIIIFLYQVIHRHGPLSRTIADSLRQILKIGTPFLNSHTESSSLLEDDPSCGVALLSSTGEPFFPDPTPEEATEAGVSYFGLQSCRIGAWFIAGTCTTLKRDRELCRRAILPAGPNAQGCKDNVAALERIWKEGDEAGHYQDWREVLQRAGLFVSWCLYAELVA